MEREKVVEGVGDYTVFYWRNRWVPKSATLLIPSTVSTNKSLASNAILFMPLYSANAYRVYPILMADFSSGRKVSTLLLFKGRSILTVGQLANPVPAGPVSVKVTLSFGSLLVKVRMSPYGVYYKNRYFM